MDRKMPGAIAAGHEKTAEAGSEMFQLGGNAFDAAVAAILAAFVTEPMLTSPAGGGFLLAHTSAKQNILFDFFTQTPRQKRLLSEVDFYPIAVDFGDAIQTFHIGKGSMAVPGNIMGLVRVHQKLGRLPFKVVAEPAIHYAANGVKVNEFQAYSFQLLKPIILASPESRKVFTPTGSLLQQGDMLVMKDLAATLTELSATGIEAFYRGEIARQVTENCQERGGYLTLEDFQKYRVIEREPLVINYRDRTLLTNPPPSSGGTLLAFALSLLSQVDLKNIEFGSDRHLQLLCWILRLTNEARNDGYDPFIYQPDIAEKFLSADHLEIYRQKLAANTNKWGSTTHISAIDSEGNAASVTTSNGEGSGYVIPGTGIMVNNMLGEEDINPLGFHQWRENSRISSMMSPTIVLKDGRPEIVLGSGGSKRIRTAILQVISNLIDFEMPVELAVESPRCHWEDDRFNVEFGWEDTAANQLQLPESTELAKWQQKNMFFGGVHTAIKTDRGAIAGAGDSRRSGVVRIMC
jgi:gamma-glutamyltranspeptidase/glutathione hydrolase